MTADTITAIKKALEAAEQFIVNGVALGYIRMPDPQTPDSAHETLPMIRQAQTALESLQRENEALKNLIDGDTCADPDKIDALFRRAEAAEAEVKRLREALEKINDGYGGNHMSTFCRFTASEALASTGGENHADK